MKLDTEWPLTSKNGKIAEVSKALEDCSQQSTQWQKSSTVGLEDCEQSEVISEVKMELSR